MKKVVFVLLVLAMSGCKQVRYVSAPESHSEKERSVELDTFYRDMWHFEYVKGDSVVVRDSVVVFRSKLSTDTVVKTDSVVVVDEVALKERDDRISMLERDSRNTIIVLSFVILFLIAIIGLLFFRKWQKE